MFKLANVRTCFIQEMGMAEWLARGLYIHIWEWDIPNTSVKFVEIALVVNTTEFTGMHAFGMQVVTMNMIATI